MSLSFLTHVTLSAPWAFVKTFDQCCFPLLFPPMHAAKRSLNSSFQLLPLLWARTKVASSFSHLWENLWPTLSPSPWVKETSCFRRLCWWLLTSPAADEQFSPIAWYHGSCVMCENRTFAPVWLPVAPKHAALLCAPLLGSCSAAAGILVASAAAALQESGQ